MILSMTGYGTAVAVYQDKKIHVEVKSLNSKAFDLSTRIAPLFRDREMEIRQMLQGALVRGKVDFSLWIEQDASTAAAHINKDLLGVYHQQLRTIVAELGIPEPQDWLQTLMRLPDVTAKPEVEPLGDEEWAAAKTAIASAIDDLTNFRRQEGEALQKKFELCVSHIAEHLKNIEPYETGRVEKIKSRLLENLKKIPEAEYNQNRLEQELIYYIEKLDINEEKQRLTNHLNYFLETLHGEPGQGKKLGFIAQEMGREINTTGSKSNQAEMQNLVVKMKDELEQIKEQVLNVL